MKRTNFFNPLAILFIFAMFISCEKELEDENENGNTTKKEGEYSSFVIETNLLNPEEDEGVYNVYLIRPGELKTEPGAATQSGFYEAVTTNSEGKATFNLKDYGIGLSQFIKNTENLKLDVVVATKEDIYLRNPLNEITSIQFVENKDEDTNWETPVFSTVEKVEVDFTDKYPEGVLSLTFQDATFVIKLNFAEGVAPASSYEVFIVGQRDGFDNYMLGRICRPFQYWDTPFYEEDDNLSDYGGKILVRRFDNDQEVNYEGNPIELTFDENGKCNQGDIVNITIIE